MPDDNRVMSAEARSAEARMARIVETIGDGSGITADEFATFSVAARQHLYRTNLDRYRELQAELDRRVALGSI